MITQRYFKISPTAIFCARMRAKQKLPFGEEIVRLVDTKFKDLIKDLPDYGDTLNSKSDFISYIEGRYYSLNDAISKIDNAFIVEIASGLSPRCLEFLHKRNVIYVDTDLRGLVDLKKKIFNDIIKKNKTDDKNLIFMAVNPLIIGDMDKLGRLYKRKGGNKQLFVIHEGLLMYFDRNEKRILRENIKYLFNKYAKKGLWLTTDFSRIETGINEPKGKENIRDKISKVTKREFNYFKSKNEIEEFLGASGFKFKILPNKKIISSLIGKKRLSFNKPIILDSSKNYRVWKIELS